MGILQMTSLSRDRQSWDVLASAFANGVSAIRVDKYKVVYISGVFALAISVKVSNPLLQQGLSAVNPNGSPRDVRSKVTEQECGHRGDIDRISHLTSS